MSKRTTIVVHPDGTFDQRSSVRRVYTSAIVRRTDQWETAEWIELESIPRQHETLSRLRRHLDLAKEGRFTTVKHEILPDYTTVGGIVDGTDYYLGTLQSIDKIGGDIGAALVTSIERTIDAYEINLEEMQQRQADLKAGPQYGWKVEGWRSEWDKACAVVCNYNDNASATGGFTESTYYWYVTDAIEVPAHLKPADYAAQIRTIMENGAAAS